MSLIERVRQPQQVSSDQELKQLVFLAERENLPLSKSLTEQVIETVYAVLKIPKKDLLEVAQIVDNYSRNTNLGQAELARTGTIMSRVRTYLGLGEKDRVPVNREVNYLLRHSIALTYIRCSVADTIETNTTEELYSDPNFYLSQMLCSRLMFKVLATRRKRGDTVKEHHKDPEVRAQWARLNTGKKRTAEQKARMSLSAKQRVQRDGPESMALFTGRKHKKSHVEKRRRISKNQPRLSNGTFARKSA